MTQVWSEEARTTKLNSRWTSIGTTVSTAESKSFQMDSGIGKMGQECSEVVSAEV